MNVCLGVVIGIEDHANIALENRACVVDGESPAEVVLCKLIAFLTIIYQPWCEEE